MHIFCCYCCCNSIQIRAWHWRHNRVLTTLMLRRNRPTTDNDQHAAANKAIAINTESTWQSSSQTHTQYTATKRRPPSYDHRSFNNNHPFMPVACCQYHPSRKINVSPVLWWCVNAVIKCVCIAESWPALRQHNGQPNLIVVAAVGMHHRSKTHIAHTYSMVQLPADVCVHAARVHCNATTTGFFFFFNCRHTYIYSNVQQHTQYQYGSCTIWSHEANVRCSPYLNIGSVHPSSVSVKCMHTIAATHTHSMNRALVNVVAVLARAIHRAVALYLHLQPKKNKKKSDDDDMNHSRGSVKQAATSQPARQPNTIQCSIPFIYCSLDYFYYAPYIYYIHTLLVAYCWSFFEINFFFYFILWCCVLYLNCIDARVASVSWMEI